MLSLLTRTRFFNKIAIQGTPQMAVDKEAICLSRVYSYYPKCNFPLFYVILVYSILEHINTSSMYTIS